MGVSEELKKLENLIPQYADNKSELDYFKKICDAENYQIKRLMTELNLDDYCTEKYKVTKSVQNRQNLNEDILLDMFLNNRVLKETASKYNIVKTKSYVDMEALEKAIYDEGFSNEELLLLNKAMESKEIVSLRISKIKKEKENKDVH